jgi:hypothetical protein
MLRVAIGGLCLAGGFVSTALLLVSTADFAVAEGFGPDVKLTRTQAMMQGAGPGDFRYKRVEEAD